MGASPRVGPRIVLVSPILPYAAVPHAGGVYLRQLHQSLVRGGAEVTFLVPPEPNATEAVGQPGAPDRVLMLGRTRRRTLPRRALMRTAYSVDGWVRRWDPTWPPLAFAVQLFSAGDARAALEAADVVDVHWPEYARLVPLIRRINPRARIVSTLHDVLSQRWERAAQAASEAELPRATRGAASARRIEQSVLRQADVVVVFSDKDRELLRAADGPAAETVEVVTPPLSVHVGFSPAGPPTWRTALFVSLLARTENDDAAHWLVTEIWPSVAARVPGARLQLVGKGASARLTRACARRTDVDLLGYVDDLSALYERATACVIPLRLGAGVKFKAIEGLLAGVPTVTTTVGAEGIAGPEVFAAVSDDPGVLADTLTEVLMHPDAFAGHALEAQGWARERYSEERFRKLISRIYVLGQT